MNERCENPAPFSLACGRLAVADIKLRPKLNRLVRLAVKAASASACIVSWRTDQASDVTRVPAGARWTAVLTAVLAAAQRECELGHSPPVHLPSPRLAELVGKGAAGDLCYEAVAHIAAAGSVHVLALMLGLRGRPIAELAAAAEVTANSALGILAASEVAASRDFWRIRAIEASERAALTQSALLHDQDERRQIEKAVAAAARLQPRDRLAGLGSILAGFGQFEGWIIASAMDGRLHVEAAAGIAVSVPRLDSECALAASLRNNSVILRRPNLGPAVYQEDRLFRRFSAYACLPFSGGAIALAAHHQLDRAAVKPVEMLLHRLNPIIDNWLATTEIDQLRQLVRTLGIRMFAAVDSERARIARDLHDHQAQLLAAARIGLEAGPDEARAIFKQVEDVLRLRVRELRPPMLGRSTLEEALRYELRRVAEGGIKGRLLHSDRMNRLTRPVQQLCYQAAREALSNVVRHSGATRVEISAEKRSGRVRLTITDNGSGFDHAAITRRHHAANGNSGLGLIGLAERLEIMGGSLALESRAGLTSVIAEIPEPV